MINSINWHNEVQLVTGKTLFNVVHQSVEAFRTTTDVRDLRASRGESGQGIQAGDVIVNISHLLYEDGVNGRKELYFTTHLKTAAGPLNNARFTDAPAYAFFFSHGRWNLKYSDIGLWTFLPMLAFRSIRPIGWTTPKTMDFSIT